MLINTLYWQHACHRKCETVEPRVDLGGKSNQTRQQVLLVVQDAVEKDSFFKQLPGQLPAIPKPVAQKKLLPQLSQALEFGGAPASALGALRGCAVHPFRHVVATLSIFWTVGERLPLNFMVPH